LTGIDTLTSVDWTSSRRRLLRSPDRADARSRGGRGDGPLCVCELVEPLGLAQPTVSHHLRKLLDAGLVERQQGGKWAYFSLQREAVEKLAAVADLKGAC
jgi:DNA-binding transcriptional ArsR family regulator